MGETKYFAAHVAAGIKKFSWDLLWQKYIYSSLWRIFSFSIHFAAVKCYILWPRKETGDERASTGHSLSAAWPLDRQWTGMQLFTGPLKYWTVALWTIPCLQSLLQMVSNLFIVICPWSNNDSRNPRPRSLHRCISGLESSPATPQNH